MKALQKRTKQTTGDSQVQVRGRVERLFYAASHFSAGRLSVSPFESISFAGPLMVQVGDSVALYGQWMNHATYGRQLQVERFEYDMPLDAAGLAHYLANNPVIKGIGKVKARQLAEKYAFDFEDSLRQRPEEMAASIGVSLATITSLRQVWQRSKAFNVALTWLSAFGLTHHQVTTLIDRFGNDVVAVLKSNPYLLTKEVKGYGFRKVDDIALKMGLSKSSPKRIRAGIMSSIGERIESGDCWVDCEEVVEIANRLLVMDDFDSRERIERELDCLIDKGELVCESHHGRFIVARPDLRGMEHDLETWFRAGAELNPHFTIEDDLEDLINTHAPTLNAGQRKAAKTALSARISMISGGAGSGKTFTIASITKICKARGLKVVLTAPTGKAAKRMEQVVGQEGFTIHRLLGYQGSQFTAGPENPVAADILVVDEFSMVDVPLAWYLFRSLDLQKTAVILVGDHNQLPPVGPGNLLRDLLDTRLIPGVVLDEVVRQAGILKENSIAILRGEVLRTAEESSQGRRPWYLVDQFTDVSDIQRFIVDLYETVLVDKLGFDLLRDVQLLTPTKRGELGVDALNIILQRVIQKKLFGVDLPPPPPHRRPKFRRYDRVIQTRNNYELGVMNGATGVVVKVTEDGGLIIQFESQRVEIESKSDNLGDISLAYALTVHKVQGSEYPCVIALIHKSHSFMHNRNLFYTAVTRARQTAIVIGDRWGLRNCASKRLVEVRKTFLGLATKDVVESYRVQAL